MLLLMHHNRIKLHLFKISLIQYKRIFSCTKQLVQGLQKKNEYYPLKVVMAQWLDLSVMR